MITVRFSKLQLEEIQHKASIVRDEPDLQESYELTEGQAIACSDFFLQAMPGSLTFERSYIAMLIGEIENLVEIAQDNLDCAENRMQHLSYMSSLKGLVRKLKAAE